MSRTHRYTFEQLVNEDFMEKSHIEAFERALRLDEYHFDHPNGLSSPSTPAAPVTGSSRTHFVSASSDFAPIHSRVDRGKKKHKRHDWSYLIFRWPLLIFIFLFIAAEFNLYVLVRQLVNGKEWITAWRGKKGHLRKKLRAARTYEEWKEVAIELDEYLQSDEWKKTDEDPFYDWKLVQKVKNLLRALREKKDARGCLGVLETCTRPNFAAIESSRLYSEVRFTSIELVDGTEAILDVLRNERFDRMWLSKFFYLWSFLDAPLAYFDELERSLEFIRETSEISLEEKKQFFKSTNTNLGITALCLSGGGTLGYYHFGVIKAFLEEGLLPRVISGTSAGGLAAALACTRTDEELEVLLDPRLADKITACEEPFFVYLDRFLRTGARFDSTTWAKKSTFFTRGSMTFKEAYERTGRILNVSVVPHDRYSPTKVLNYITAPDTVIWSALLASAAVPGILNPVVLMQKLKDSSLVPWSWGSRFKDGSLRVDIPTQALNLYFNVTNPVVSQANPHVHLFFFAPRGSAGKPVAHQKGWRGNFLLSAAEQWLKHELTKNFRVIRDLELLPTLLGSDWSSVFLQRFDGAITIWPRTRFMDFIRILTDPDPPELQRMMQVGQLVTWPKLHMISNRTRIEKQILLGRQATRALSQPRSIPPKPRLMRQSQERNSERRSTLLSISSGSEKPISVDPDPEDAFPHSSRWSYDRGRKKRTQYAMTEPVQEASHDPLSSMQVRRKWAQDFLSPAEESDAEGDQSHSFERENESRFSSQIFLKNDIWSNGSSSDDTPEKFRYFHNPNRKLDYSSSEEE